MFPRYFMSEGMQKAGLFTINAWAIDGFTKVFWRDQPISSYGRRCWFVGDCRRPVRHCTQGGAALGIRVALSSRVCKLSSFFANQLRN